VKTIGHRTSASVSGSPVTVADWGPLNTGNLLVGHDRHPASDCAVRVAVQLADLLHAHLHIVHVVTLEDYPIDPDGADWELGAARTLKEEGEAVTEMLADATVSWTYHERRGDPARCLEELARDYNVPFIIVGASTAGVVPHLIHGSVSRSLLHHRRTPVLVVPAPAPHS
jgi:nucleotide-binding universal stress UspA family protein